MFVRDVGGGRAAPDSERKKQKYSQRSTTLQRDLAQKMFRNAGETHRPQGRLFLHSFSYYFTTP
jgi:hypothetical protein